MEKKGEGAVTEEGKGPRESIAERAYTVDEKNPMHNGEQNLWKGKQRKKSRSGGKNKKSSLIVGGGGDCKFREIRR